METTIFDSGIYWGYRVMMKFGFGGVERSSIPIGCCVVGLGFRL